MGYPLILRYEKSKFGMMSRLAQACRSLFSQKCLLSAALFSFVTFLQAEEPKDSKPKSFDEIMRENEEWLKGNTAAPGNLEPMSPFGAVNSIVLRVTFIAQRKAGTTIGFATGFFYSRGETVFLVTNKHVMRDDNAKDEAGISKPVVPDVLRLRLHTDARDIRKTRDLDIPLYKGKEKLWKIHPVRSDADVAVIKLDAALLKKEFLIDTWSSKQFLPKNFLLSPGDDVFIMGYPLGLHDEIFNLPIFRNAMVASTYRVPFQGAPYFLTDANLHPGTSGSPVITKPKTSWVTEDGGVSMLTGTTYFLVGINSAMFTTNRRNEKDIGLGQAWYAELIEDIAGSF